MSSNPLDPVLRAHSLWLAREPEGVRADFTSQRLSGAALRGADLRQASFRGASLRGADLRQARLGGADLRHADLGRADLTKADLSGADLRFSSLEGADLTGAVLAGADLRKCRFDGLKMSWFDATLISERLWQAAGDSLEHQMLAAFVGRVRGWCWNEYRVLAPERRFWILSQFRQWLQEGDEAPAFLKLASASRIDQLAGLGAASKRRTASAPDSLEVTAS